MTEQTELIAILKDAINHKKSDVKEYNDRLDQNLSKKIELLENLKKDVNEITKVDINQINEMIDAFKIKEEEKNNLKKELDIIKAVLTLNKTKKTNYTLLPNQLAAITTFVENLEKYIENKNLEKQSIDPEYNHIMSLTKQYKKLLSQLKKPNQETLITDIDTILEMFQEEAIGEEEKQAILLSLIKYNYELTRKKEVTITSKNKKMTVQELSLIFKKYGYAYEKLDKKYKDKLRSEGNRRQIEEVFSTMQKLEFTKLDEKTEGLLLTTYLLATSKENLEEITKIAQQRGINMTTIEKLVSAYIPNEYILRVFENIKHVSDTFNDENRVPYYLIRTEYICDGKYSIGRKEDFKKNVSLLVEHGISIPYVAEKEKEILILTNKRLQENLEWLERYGLYSEEAESSLLDDFLSALKSPYIPEMIDIWIESHPLGLRYIKNNLTALSTNIETNKLLFHKLHLSATIGNNEAFRLTMSNGVKKLLLRKEITNDDIEYQGIHDMASAKKVNNQKEIRLKMAKEYQSIARESLHHAISITIFEYPEIISLDRFSDSKESLLYDINGLRISKLKVLRIYNALCEQNLGKTIDALLFAITYHKILTEEEYNDLVINIKQTTGLEEII